jgi:hypothetical protein
MRSFKTVLNMAFFLLLMLATVASSSADQKPSGTLSFEEQQIMAIVGGTSGYGTLEFNDTKTLFKVSGVSVGASIGVHKLKVSGEVFDLADIADFSGMYVDFEAGATFVEGASGMWLKNDKGVILHLKSQNEGVALELGSGGLNISVW